MPFSNVPEDPAEQATFALRQMVAIHTAADGRELTRSQDADYGEARNLFSAALDRIPGGSNAYARALLGQMRQSPRSAEEREVDVDVAKQLERIIKVSSLPDAMRGQMARIEASMYARADDTPTLRDLFSRVADQGGAAIEYRATDLELSLRALQSAGGSAIETSYGDLVTVYARTISPQLNPAVVTVKVFDDGSPRFYPRLTADPNHGGTITAEAGGINELDATFSQITLNPYKYAITNLWSAELGQDSAIPLEDLVASSTARELGLDIGTHLTSGDGSAKPQGFAADGYVNGTVTASGTANNAFFGPDDIVDAFYSLAAPYRERASWQVSNTALAKIRKLKDANGQHLWSASLQPGQPESLLGRPIYENPALAAVGSASRSVYVGDFSRYVVQMTPVRVEGSKDYRFNTDQIALRTIFRVDGDLMDANAIACLKSANA